MRKRIFKKPSDFMFEKKSVWGLMAFPVISFITIVLTLLVACVVWFYGTHNYYPIIGTSMLPTLQDEGEAAYIDYSNSGTYGDIIIAFNNEHIRVVKRLVALGGDKIGFYHDALTNNYYMAMIYKGSDEITILYNDYIEDVSGNVVTANYLRLYNQHLKTFETINYNGQDILFVVVPEDSVFVLGDNRAGSQDSAIFGPIEKKFILGKVDLIVQHESVHLFDILGYILKLRGSY